MTLRTTGPTGRRQRTSLTERAALTLSGSATGRRLAKLRLELADRRSPLRWSNLFGAVAAACLVVLVVTGAVLMLWYVPSGEHIEHGGAPSSPLAGADASAAYDSVLRISFDVPGGLLVRQVHHWAALLLPAALLLQLAVTFFTGAFRSRRGSWLLLFGMLLAVLAAGWSGYALPDDGLSGTGLRIVEGIALGIPVVGTWLSWLLFGGSFPGRIIENLYPLHVAVLPVLIVVLLALRARAWRRTPTAHLPGEPVFPLYPRALARTAGIVALVIAVIVLVATTVTVSPVWLHGASAPGDASAGSQPDWYTGFLDGALRLVPPGWEVVVFGRTWSLAIVVPLAVVGLFLAALAFYPFFEAWVRNGRAIDVLDRPRNESTRTGIGAAGIVFYCTLWGAASADLIAACFHLGLETVIHAFQLMVLIGPGVAFVLTRRICLALQKKDRRALLHGYETGRVVRLPGGEFVEMHSPVPVEDRWRYAGPVPEQPRIARADADGRLHALDHLRARLSRSYAEDRIVSGEHEASRVGSDAEPSQPAGPAGRS